MNEPEKRSIEEIIKEGQKPIEKLNLKEAVNGFRIRLKKTLQTAGVIAGISTGTGYVAGDAVRDYYRDFMNYHPDEKAEVVIMPEAPETPEKKGWMDKAKDFLTGAKNKAADQVKKTDLAKAYAEMKSFYQKAVEMGDKAAFWIPFALVFLGTVMLSRKAIQAKELITGKSDPVLDKKFQVIEAKINEIIEAYDEGVTLNEGKIAALKELKEQVDQLSENI